MNILFVIMKDVTLLRTALVCAVVGLTALIILLDNVVIDEAVVAKINKDRVDETIVVSGVVKSISEKSGVVILLVEQSKAIEVLLFDGRKEDFSVGEVVEVQGRIKEYNSKYEIIADRVNYLNVD